MKVAGYSLIMGLLCILPVYAAQPQNTVNKLPARSYTFGYGKITREDCTKYAYLIYGTRGVSNGMVIAFAKEVDQLLTKYDLSESQMRAIAHGQKERIREFNTKYDIDLETLSPAGLEELLRKQEYTIKSFSEH